MNAPDNTPKGGATRSTEPGIENLSDCHRRVYDSLAEEYEKRSELHRANIARQVQDLLTLVPQNAKVLDLGCGVGTSTDEMLKARMLPTGVDISTEMVSRARLLVPQGEFICADFLSMPLDRRFDAIYAQSVVHLFPTRHLSRVFRRIRTVLAPQGILFVSTTNSPRTRAAWESKADYPLSEVRFRQHWTRDDFLALLHGESFCVIHERTMVDPFDKEWMLIYARMDI